MKLNLIRGKGQDGLTHIIGWNFEAENKQEEKDLSQVRNAIYFGLDDTYPEYAGRQDNPKSNLVKRIWYKVPINVTGLRNGKISCDNKEAVEFFKAMD